ncbi:MAG: LysM peptidoglycan-binding domain-containing protein [Clostridiales bacterium]|nr:LysM peptidoglycan-binding domain-containing protein [Clostridiales bacterium]
MIEIMYHQIPFSNAIEYVREDEEESYDCKLDISQQYTQVIPDLDGEDRILELEVIVKVEASNICSINEEIIEDIYCPGKRVVVTDETNDFMNLLHKTNLCVPKKETIRFEEMVPDNEVIYSICMKPVVEEMNMADHRLAISGTVEVAIIYLTQDATSKLASTNSMIPFMQEVEIQGVNQQSIPKVEVRASDIRILTQGKREVAIEFKLCSMIEIYNKQPLYMLQDIEINDLDEEEIKKFPSMIIYTVRPGDSYWSISKKYNTTLEEIEKLNEIDINEEIMPNQKILILKKST